MLRFFSKFRLSQISGTSTRKYLLYAIGEILLVVIGILIALQINNWNENSKKQVEEIKILKNLKSDLLSDLDQLQLDISSTSIKMSRIDSLFAILKNPKEYNLQDLIRFNREIPFVDYFLASSGTYDEGISSGKMSYLKTDTLRQQIFDYYRLIKLGGTDAVTNKFVEEIIIPEWGELVIPNKESLLYLGFESNLPHIDVESLSKSKKYNQLLAQKYANNQAQIENWKDIIIRAEGLIIDIDIDLDNKQ